MRNQIDGLTSPPEPLSNANRTSTYRHVELTYEYGETHVRVVYNRETRILQIYSSVLLQLSARYWHERLESRDVARITEFLRQETGLVFTPTEYLQLRKGDNMALGVDIDDRAGVSVQDLYGNQCIHLLEAVE